MSQSSPPPTRAERQRHIRAALLAAARTAFARDGYHAASLEGIAREAGYTKGAVYSNFEGKAALFLAVMDADMAAAADAGGVDATTRPALAAFLEPADEASGAAMRGWVLATLEFIAAAARDERLAAELASRIGRLVTAYTPVAEGGADASADPNGSTEAGAELTPPQLGALLAALDQGAALLAVLGPAELDDRVLQEGMRRLLRSR